MADRIRVSTEALETWAQDVNAVQRAISEAESILSGFNLSKDNGGELRVSISERLCSGALIDGEDVTALVRSLNMALRRTGEDAEDISTGLLRAAAVFEDAEASIDGRTIDVSSAKAAFQALSGAKDFATMGIGGIGIGKIKDIINGDQEKDNDIRFPGHHFAEVWKSFEKFRNLLRLEKYYEENPGYSIVEQQEQDEKMLREIRDLLKDSRFNKIVWDNASSEEKKKILEVLIPELNRIYGTNVINKIDFYEDRESIAQLENELNVRQEELNYLEKLKEEHENEGICNIVMEGSRENKGCRNLEEIEKRENEIKKEIADLKARANVLIGGQYNDENRQVMINTYTMDGKSYEEIMEVLVHEMRHAYQHEAVRRPGEFIVSKDNALSWAENIVRYTDPKKEPHDYEGYMNQPIEVDARAFEDSLY